MKVTLTTDEIHMLLNSEIYDQEVDNEFLLSNILNSKDWVTLLVLMKYLLGKSLEKMNKEQNLDKQFVKKVFLLSEKMNLRFMEMDVDFLDVMFQNERCKNSTLEELLLEITERMYIF